MKKILFKISSICVFKNFVVVDITQIEKCLRDIIGKESFEDDEARFIVANANNGPVLITWDYFVKLIDKIHKFVDMDKIPMSDSQYSHQRTNSFNAYEDVWEKWN